MKKIILFLIFATCCFPNTKAQDYTAYYEYIDSIDYFSSLDTQEGNSKADKLYVKCFQRYRAFGPDYFQALVTSYKVSGVVCDTWVYAAIRDGVPKFKVISILERNDIQFSKKTIRRISRKAKKQRSKKTIRNFPIYRMLLKDQMARRKNFDRDNEVDSLNASVLRNWVTDKPDMFNYHKTGPLAAIFLQILLFHGEWANIAPIQTELRCFVQKGYLDRSVLPYLIERNAVSDGFVFQLDTLNHEIKAIKKSIDTTCLGNCYYSSIGYEWGQIWDSTRHIRVLPPMHPNLTHAEIDAMRKHLFLSDLNLLYATKKYKSAESVEEYCELFRAKQLKLGEKNELF
jgi:hypothetical protein